MSDKHMMELYKQIHEELERERRENEQIIKYFSIINSVYNLGSEIGKFDWQFRKETYLYLDL